MSGADLRDTRPLVVDLDGTLLRTDLLVETASQFAARHPFRALRLVGWLTSGRSALKARLAEKVDVDPAGLPYHQELMHWLREQKAKGRRLVLATASHRLPAERVAEYLGIFDEVLASDESTNLKAGRKRDELVGRYGEGGFDYVGGGAADLAVWKSAHSAYVVSSSARLISRARANGNIAQVFDDGGAAVVRSLVRGMRPAQWVKNILVLVPLFAAHRHEDATSVGRALLTLAAFCLAASAAYLLNDVVDIRNDRHHRRKSQRPFASGQLSLLWGWAVWPLLLVAAFVIAGLLLPASAVWALAAYVVVTVAYSLRLKQIVMIDVLILAGLYTLRVAAGAFAIEAPLSFWLLAFSLSIFLSLALVKRYCELRSDEAKEEREVRGRGYTQSDLAIVSSLGTGAGYVAVLILALYVQDAGTARLYSSPRYIWLACPVLLYWISRVWFIAHRGQMHDDPLVFALKDWVSWVVAVCLVGLFLLAGLVP